jgi:hypothetical protein
MACRWTTSTNGRPTLYITQAKLRERLQSLRDGGYTILPLSEATRRLYEGTLPARSVALTFDDGAIDFERRALPVLREFNAPATLYLTTFYCASRPTRVRHGSRVCAVEGSEQQRGRLVTLCIAGVVDGDERLRTEEDAQRSSRIRDTRANERRAEKRARGALAGMLGVDYAAIVERGTLQIMTPGDGACTAG